MKDDKVSFTPGPWHLRNNDLCVAYSDGELVSYIANVQEATLCPEHGNAQANARLIASAPELLEALKAMHKRFITESEWITASDEVLERENIALIAKAEGRE